MSLKNLTPFKENERAWIKAALGKYVSHREIDDVLFDAMVSADAPALVIFPEDVPYGQEILDAMEREFVRRRAAASERAREQVKKHLPHFDKFLGELDAVGIGFTVSFTPWEKDD